jgi:pilus assembly protein CpaE
VDMVQNFHRMDADLLASYIEQHESGIHLLSAPYHPERAATVTAEEIRRILHFLRHHYDYIVVDTPKSYSAPTLAVFDQADTVFLVTTVDLPSLRNIQRGLPLLKRVLPRGEEQLRLIVNRYNPRNEISLDDVQRTLGLRLFGRLHNDYEAVVHSLNTGRPIVLDGKSTYAKDIRALGAEIAGVGQGSGRGKAGAATRGVMGRLFGRVRGGNDRRGKENNR